MLEIVLIYRLFFSNQGKHCSLVLISHLQLLCSPDLNAFGCDGVFQLLLFSVELDGEVGQGSELRRLSVGLQMFQGS